MNIKILLAGDGGQGIQTIANLIVNSVFETGFYVSEIPNYGLEQRGGVSLSYLQIQDSEIVYPKFSMADIILLLSDQAKERTKKYITNDTMVIDVDKYKTQLKDIRISSYNIFFLGIIAKKLISQDIIKQNTLLTLLEKKLGQKLFWPENKEAFNKGLNN